MKIETAGQLLKQLMILQDEGLVLEDTAFVVQENEDDDYIYGVESEVADDDEGCRVLLVRTYRPMVSMADSIIEALTIFKKYDPDVEISAEHDSLFGISDEAKLSPADARRLRQLDWHNNYEASDCWGRAL